MIPRNGDPTLNGIADALEKIDEHITGKDGLFVRMDRVERGLEQRPCEDHADKIDALTTATNDTSRRWDVVGRWAVTIGGLIAIGWKVLG